MSFKTLVAHQKGFDLAIEIFHLTKDFPKSEIFGLTSQIVHENSETQLWLNFALACEYI